MTNSFNLHYVRLTYSEAAIASAVRIRRVGRPLCMGKSRNIRRGDGRSPQDMKIIVEALSLREDRAWQQEESFLAKARPGREENAWFSHLDAVHDECMGKEPALLDSAEQRIRVLLEKLEVAWGERDWKTIKSVLGAVFVIASSPVSRWNYFNTKGLYFIDDLIEKIGAVGKGDLARRRKTLRVIASTAESWHQALS